MNDSIPVVSIALATCNGASFLRQQLDSIEASTFKAIEIVACDDDSNDETVAILETYTSKLPIEIYRNSNRLGYVKNFEKAIGLCRGRYIALCDQDDIWHPDKLARSVEAVMAAEHNGSATLPVMVHSDSRLIDGKGEVIAASYQRFKGYAFHEHKQYGAMLCRCGVMGHTMLMNRALVEQVLPFPAGTKHHDYWIALVNEWCGQRISLKQALVDHRVHGKNSGGSAKQGKKMSWSFPCHEVWRYRLLRRARTRFKIPLQARYTFGVMALYLRRRQKLLPLYFAMAAKGFFPVGFFRHCSRLFRMIVLEWRGL